jgi:hypothetical protein
MEKNELKTSLIPFLAVLKLSFFMHRFLIVPSYPAPLLGQDIMKKLGMFLVMSQLSGLLMFQKGPKSVHKILLEVNQKVSPSTWYDGIS